MDDSIGSFLLEYILAHSNINPPIEFSELDTQEPKRQINWPKETLDILKEYHIFFFEQRKWEWESDEEEWEGQKVRKMRRRIWINRLLIL